jgi:hypothetical protein
MKKFGNSSHTNWHQCWLGLCDTSMLVTSCLPSSLSTKVYVQKSVSFTSSSHIYFSWSVSCFCSLTDNTRSLFSVEVMYTTDEWHTCLQITKFFCLAYQWRYLQPSNIRDSGCGQPHFLCSISCLKRTLWWLSKCHGHKWQITEQYSITQVLIFVCKGNKWNDVIQFCTNNHRP